MEGNRALYPAPPGFLPDRLLGVHHFELPPPALYAGRPRIPHVRPHPGPHAARTDRGAAQAARRGQPPHLGAVRRLPAQHGHRADGCLHLPLPDAGHRSDRLAGGLDAPAGRDRAGDCRRRGQPAGHPGRVAAWRRH